MPVYTAREALDIARGYWPGATAFVGVTAYGRRTVGYMGDDGIPGERFTADTFNEALELAAPRRFPVRQWIAEA